MPDILNLPSIEIGEEEFLAFIRTQPGKCWQCGSETWQIVAENGRMTQMMFLIVDGPEPTGRAFTTPVIAITCRKCANIWMVSAEYARSLIGQKGAENE